MNDVFVRALGTDILVRCSSTECANDIRRFFGPLAEPPWRSPDLVIECSWKRADRYLFRARPADAEPTLAGISVTCADGTHTWKSHHPPILPMSCPPLAGRFLGLHAAAVQAPAPRRGVLLAAGVRGTGKTTLALKLVNEHGWSLLTDETAFVHVRTQLVEPFPRPVGYRSTREEPKRFDPADVACRSIARSAGLIDVVVVLVLGSGSPTLARLSEGDAMRHLLDHRVEVSGDVSEGVTTLAQLVRAAPVYRLTFEEYRDLCDAVEELATRFERQLL